MSFKLEQHFLYDNFRIFFELSKYRVYQQLKQLSITNFIVCRIKKIIVHFPQIDFNR